MIGNGNTIIGGNTNVINNITNNNFNNWNIHNGNNNFYRPGWNRPGWDNGGWNRPGWGWGGGGTWHDSWHSNCINNHYSWYNGCWSGNYWGSNWYAPLAWGAVGWGLGAMTTGWGYGASYANPYYVASAAPVYNYSQPVVVYNYATDDGSTAIPVAQTAQAAGTTATAAIAPPAADSPGVKEFDAGLALFKDGNYRQALGQFDAALKALPGDPVIHEVRALALFALGEYQPAAAALNSLLSAAPGMDWTTMSGLYGNPSDYTTQLRSLEEYCRQHPTDGAPYFVLAYHYLVTGAKDAAVGALKTVVQNQPQDTTAKRMLDALDPPPPAAESVANSTPTTPEPPPSVASPDPVAPAPPADEKPATDLVGEWQAKAGGSTIELTITEDSKFTWKAAPGPRKPPIELKGEIGGAGQQLVLESADQGAMSGEVKSDGPDKWKFTLTGAPANDPGLTFERVKKG